MNLRQTLEANNRVVSLAPDGQLGLDMLNQQIYTLRRHRECATTKDGDGRRVATIDVMVPIRTWHYLLVSIKRRLSAKYGPAAIAWTKKMEEEPCSVDVMGMRLSWFKYDEPEAGCTVAVMYDLNSPIADDELWLLDWSDIFPFTLAVEHPERHLLITGMKSLAI